MSAPVTTSMLTVMSGRECLGFIMARGKLGFEAINAEQRTLGTFPTQREAADAIFERAAS